MLCSPSPNADMWPPDLPTLFNLTFPYAWCYGKLFPSSCVFFKQGKAGPDVPRLAVILDHIVISAGGFVPLAPTAHPRYRSPWTVMAWSVLSSHQLELPCPLTVLLVFADM